MFEIGKHTSSLKTHKFETIWDIIFKSWHQSLIVSPYFSLLRNQPSNSVIAKLGCGTAYKNRFFFLYTMCFFSGTICLNCVAVNETTAENVGYDQNKFSTASWFGITIFFYDDF